MLVNTLVAILIMTIISSSLFRLKELKPSTNYIGSILLFHKFRAMNQSQYESFKISSKEYASSIHIDVADCELIFHPKGTASKAGTCKGENITFTLRPAEGGIGYPW